MVEKLPQTILESVALIPLPALPQVLVRFLALVDDERTTMADLARVVAQDPAFTAQFLTIASAGALAFSFVFHRELGPYRDWDILAVNGFVGLACVAEAEVLGPAQE